MQRNPQQQSRTVLTVSLLAVTSLVLGASWAACTIHTGPGPEPVAAEPGPPPPGEPPAEPGSPPPAEPGGATPAGEMEEAPPVTCSGNEDLTVSRKIIRAAESAVFADGNCNLTLVDCRIETDGPAMILSGNADVRILRSFIKGGGLAAHVSGNAEIFIKDSEIHGSIDRSGSAELHDEGGNTWR